MLGPWGMGQGSSWPRGSETVECWSHSETLVSSPAWSWTCRTLQRLQDITSRAKLRGCVSDAGVTRKMIHGKGEVLRTCEQWVIHLVMPCGHFHACGGQLNKLLCLLTFTTSILKPRHYFIKSWKTFGHHLRTTKFLSDRYSRFTTELLFYENFYFVGMRFLLTVKLMKWW